MQKAVVYLLADLCIIMLGRQNDFRRHVHWSADNSLGRRVDIMLHASTLLSTPQQHVFTQQGPQAQALGAQLYSSCMAGCILQYPSHGDVIVSTDVGLFHGRT